MFFAAQYIGLCGFQGSQGPVSKYFRWRMAKGKHLFPFRTEQLSLSAPMVLGGQPPGRVGRRRFFLWAAFGRPFFVPGSGHGPSEAGAGMVGAEAEADAGSRPYSPRVAKSIRRSMASRTRSRAFSYLSNIGSYDRSALGRNRLHRAISASRLADRHLPGVGRGG